MVAPIAKPIADPLHRDQGGGAERAVLEELGRGLRDLLRGGELALVEDAGAAGQLPEGDDDDGGDPAPEEGEPRSAGCGDAVPWVRAATVAVAASVVGGHGAHVYGLNRLKSSETLDFGDVRWLTAIRRRWRQRRECRRHGPRQHRTTGRSGDPRRRFAGDARRGVARGHRRARGVRRRPGRVRRGARRAAGLPPAGAGRGGRSARSRSTTPAWPTTRRSDMATVLLTGRGRAHRPCWRSPAPRSSGPGTRRPGRSRSRARLAAQSAIQDGADALVDRRRRPGDASWCRARTSPRLAAGWRLARVGDRPAWIRPPE